MAIAGVFPYYFKVSVPAFPGGQLVFQQWSLHSSSRQDLHWGGRGACFGFSFVGFFACFVLWYHLWISSPFGNWALLRIWPVLPMVNESDVATQLHPSGCITLAMTCIVLLLTTLYHFCTRFADKFGARAALILSCASGSAFFLLMSISTSIPLLFLSRLPAVFMHGLPGNVGQGWGAFQIAFIARVLSPCSHCSSQQAQQHEGRQEEHLMVIRDEMVRTWRSRFISLWKAGLLACSPRSILLYDLVQIAWTSSFRHRWQSLAGSSAIPNFSAVFLQPWYFIGELFLFLW